MGAAAATAVSTCVAAAAATATTTTAGHSSSASSGAAVAEAHVGGSADPPEPCRTEPAALTSDVTASLLPHEGAEDGRVLRRGRGGRGQQKAPNLRTTALDAFYAANVPNDWKECGLSVEQLEAHAKRHLVDVAVGILNLSSDWNVGAIMRTAALLKFCRFVILGRKKYDNRGAVGARRYISVQRQAGVMNARGDGIDVDALLAYFLKERLAPIFVAGRGGGRGDTRGAGVAVLEQSSAGPYGSGGVRC